MATKTQRKGKKKTVQPVNRTQPGQETREYQVFADNVAIRVYVRLNPAGRAFDAYLSSSSVAEPNIDGVEWAEDPKRIKSNVYATDPVKAFEWLQKNAALITGSGDC